MRLRAQEWIRRHPEILRRAHRRADRRGRDDAQRHHAAAATAGRRPALPLRLRLGGGRGRAPPDHRSPALDPRIAISEAREAKSRELAPDLFAIHPMYAREAEEEIVFLADAFLSHVPESGAHLPQLPVLARRAGLHAGLRLPAPDAAVPAVAEAAAGRGGSSRRALGAQVAGPPRLSGRIAGPVPRPAHRAHAPRPPRHDRLGRQPQRHPARDARRHASTCTGWARSGCSGWAGPTTARWRRATAGPTSADAGHRHRLRRRGRRSDRPSGPGLRRHRPAADRRGGRRDAALARRASPRGAAPALRPGRLRPASTSRSTSDLRCTTSVFEQYVGSEEQFMPDDPVATASQHEQELAALELIEHPVGQGGLPDRRRDLAGPGQGIRRDARAVRRRVRRGDVLGGRVVVQPGQAAAQGQLHHPAGASGGRPSNPRITLGHRQSRQRLPGDPDIGRRTLRDPRPGRRAPHDRELLHAVGRPHGHRRRAQRPHHAGRLRRQLHHHRRRRPGRRATQPRAEHRRGARVLHPRRAAGLGPRRPQSL